MTHRPCSDPTCDTDTRKGGFVSADGQTVWCSKHSGQAKLAARFAPPANVGGYYERPELTERDRKRHARHRRAAENLSRLLQADSDLAALGTTSSD